MIRFLNEKPGCFSHLPDHCLWLEGYNQDGPYCKIGLNVSFCYGGIHIEVTRWTHSILKGLLADWKEVKAILKAKGCTRAIATYTNTRVKTWPKFIRHFGFPEPRSILVSEMEI